MESVKSSFLGFSIVRFHDWLKSLDVVIGKLLKPEIVKTLNHISIVILIESLVGLLNEGIKSGKDPFIGERKLQSFNSSLLWLETFSEVGESKFVDVPKLVAELSVTNNSLDIEIDATLNHIIQKTKS